MTTGGGGGNCPRCGAHVEPGQEYCLECGLRQPGAGIAASVGTAWQHRVRRRLPGWLLPILAALLVAAVMTGVAILISRGNDEGPEVINATGPSSISTPTTETTPTEPATTTPTETETTPTADRAAPGAPARRLAAEPERLHDRHRLPARERRPGPGGQESPRGAGQRACRRWA